MKKTILILTIMMGLTSMAQLETPIENGKCHGQLDLNTNDLINVKDLKVAGIMELGEITNVEHVINSVYLIPYPIPVINGTATVSRTKKWIQSLILSSPATLDIDSSLISEIAEINLSIVAGTNTLMYSINATNIVSGLSDIAVSTNDTTTILLYSPFNKTTWEGAEL